MILTVFGYYYLYLYMYIKYFVFLHFYNTIFVMKMCTHLLMFACTRKYVCM